MPSGTLYCDHGGGRVSGASTAATTYINGTVTSVTLGAAGAGPTLNTTQLGAVPLSSGSANRLIYLRSISPCLSV